MDATKTYFMVPVSDMTRALRFYRETFGLQPTYESPEWTEVRLADGVSIAFHRGEIAPQALGLGFELADIEGACQRAVEAGGSLVRPFEARLAIVADPDGNQISLSRPATWQVWMGGWNARRLAYRRPVAMPAMRC
jgi:predicted enzyme related to lactoylglutathione lyase